MKTNKTPEIDKLYADVLDYRYSKNFEELLNFVRRFRSLAPYNAMLIHIQKPGSEYVASADDWCFKFNRTVIKGARPLLILKPFGPVSFVYEYNDTEGEPLPDEIVNPFKLNEEISEKTLDRLINNIKSEGIRVNFNNYGTSRAGLISRDETGELLFVGCAGDKVKVKHLYTIVVNDNLNLSKS